MVQSSPASSDTLTNGRDARSTWEAVFRAASNSWAAQPKGLFASSVADSTQVTEAMRKGASGAIGKDSPREDLLSAIRAVASGEQVLSPDIRRAIRKSTDIPSLSPRQHDVLESISRGLTNDDIARQYNLSKSAVKFHLLELYRKPNVSNRAEVVAIALRKHLLKI